MPHLQFFLCSAFSIEGPKKEERRNNNNLLRSLRSSLIKKDDKNHSIKYLLYLLYYQDGFTNDWVLF